MLKKKRKAIYIPKSSLVINLKPLLAQRNITYSSTYLIKIGFTSSAATKMLRGDAIGLNLNEITKLCLHLNCTPNDLFSVRSMTLDDGHALKKLRVYNEEATVSISKWLADKSLEEVENLMKL
jgi:DNA-binding Xre family transcriptional regulator